MRTKLRGPLRIFLRAGPVTEDPAPDPPPIPLVGLTLYTGDSLAFGYVPLSAGRVTDLMNDHEDFEFVDTYLESLEDRHGLTLHTIAVAGPRGDPKRRTRTRPIPVELQVGPYCVRGSIHIVPGTDPIMSFRNRRAMVPLTEATIEWDTPAGPKVARWATVLVNRLQTDWISPAARDVRPPELLLVPEMDGSGMAKDFTTRLSAD
jgi:hypothetical protein